SLSSGTPTPQVAFQLSRLFSSPCLASGCFRVCCCCSGPAAQVGRLPPWDPTRPPAGRRRR
ncbi:hypothetical protein AURDEDRAFT_144373, partial [Auricularia subglabra TFB-10046 SS5]